jgi:hypothetical protein
MLQKWGEMALDNEELLGISKSLASVIRNTERSAWQMVFFEMLTLIYFFQNITLTTC